MKNHISAEVEVKIHAPIEKVWDALTQPEQIKQYFFGTNTETDWQEGSPIRFYGEYEGKKYEDKGTVLFVKKPELIKYNYWSSMSGVEDAPENYLRITYELANSGDDVVLKVNQENIPDEKTKEHSVENWNKVLNGLKNLVERSTAPESV